MEKGFLDFTIQHLKCIPGGSKEACIKVREFIQNSTFDREGKIIPSASSAVSSEEFMESVRVLMAFAWQNREHDVAPERFICDDDCSELNHGGFCPGECQLIGKEVLEKNNDAKVKAKRCPYFHDSWDV